MGVDVVEHYILALFIGALLFWGWDFAKRHFSTPEDFSLYLVVKNQENCLEGIVRNLFRYLHKQGVSLRLVLVVEESPDQTLAIAQRLARSFSFEVPAIRNLEEWLGNSSFVEDEEKALLDLRDKNKGWTEARRVSQFVAAIKHCQEVNKKQDRLGS